MNTMEIVAEDLCSLIKQAQQGDVDAFGRLVVRFQDFAYATALRYLGDRMLAQDAAQDAFLDAYRSLPQLRVAAAFPAWLRRIVIKHSDRQVRRKRPPFVALDETPLICAASDQPHGVLERVEQAQMVRAAIDRLPELYRVVTIRFYLQNRPMREIALDLDLSLSTVKKRLFTARQQLKTKGFLMSTTYTPSQNDTFANRVQFAIALKKNDLLAIRRLLNHQPELVDTFSKWGIGSDGWYYPLGQTALHWAAGLGARDLAALLLAAGADVNSRSHRDSTPLGVAVAMNRPDLIAFLLEQGADPNVATQNGVTPLHQAVINDWPHLLTQLLDAGAKRDAADVNGRTPLDWAIDKQNGRLVRLLDGDDDMLPTFERRKPIQAGPMLETGIKIIDLMAPLKRGGNNALLTPVAGIGHDVLLAELIHNVARFHGGRTIQIGLAHGEFTEASRNLAWRNLNVEQDVETFFGRISDSDAKVRHVCERALARAAELCATGQEVLLSIYTFAALREGVMPLVNALQRQYGPHAITVLISGSHSIGNEPEAILPLDTGLTFNHRRAKQGLWPAIDPVRSYASQFADVDHQATAAAAKRLFAGYIDWHPVYEVMGMQAFDNASYTEQDRQLVVRARRLHRFLAQPLFVAEAYSARGAEFVPLAHTLEVVRGILAGEFDETPEEEMLMVGQWSPAWT